jgi:hypothetical protein
MEVWAAAPAVAPTRASAAGTPARPLADGLEAPLAARAVQRDNAGLGPQRSSHPPVRARAATARGSGRGTVPPSAPTEA